MKKYIDRYKKDEMLTEKPYIKEGGEVIGEAGKNISFTCNGSRPVNWFKYQYNFGKSIVRHFFSNI